MPFGRRKGDNNSSKTNKKEKNMDTLEIITSPSKRNKQECGSDNSKSRSKQKKNK